MNFRHRKSGYTHAGHLDSNSEVVLDCLNYPLPSTRFEVVDAPVDCWTCLDVPLRAARQVAAREAAARKKREALAQKAEALALRKEASALAARALQPELL